MSNISNKDLIHAKRVKVFVSGNRHSEGRLFYVNPKRTRTFDAFLTELTDALNPVFGAVRRLKTVDGKQEVKSVDSLEHDTSYVACGQKYLPFE